MGPVCPECHEVIEVVWETEIEMVRAATSKVDEVLRKLGHRS